MCLSVVCLSAHTCVLCALTKLHPKSEIVSSEPPGTGWGPLDQRLGSKVWGRQPYHYPEGMPRGHSALSQTHALSGRAPKVSWVQAGRLCQWCGVFLLNAEFRFVSGYMKRYRYCEYLGKYFCPRCHSNQVSGIPGRILRKWDFTAYSVSNFSHDFLRRIHEEPLFNVEDINSGLYRKVRALDQMRECREQLQHLQVFLQTCRNGTRFVHTTCVS